MGKRIPFGEPQNQSEQWAFDFLEQYLPDEIEFLTNIEVLSDSGQPFEVDAIVLGPWAIHFIDVKGYSGRVSVGKDVWERDERPIENPLPKANHVARMFAGRMARRAPQGIHMPWCQGGAFLTGIRGQSLSLVKQESKLCVWGPGEIVKALVSEEYATSQYRHKVNSRQWSLAKDVAGQTDAVLRRQNQIGDFTKMKLLHSQSGLEIWLAKYRHENYQRQFILKIVDPSGFDSTQQAARALSNLKAQASLYLELSGLAGIPYAAPLIDTGDIVALPIRLPAGAALSNVDIEKLDTPARLRILRSAGAALQGIHNRGLTHGNLKPSSIFITEVGEVELLDISGVMEAEALPDRVALADAFRNWFDDSTPRLVSWFESESFELEALRAVIALSLDPATVSQTSKDVIIESGQVLADHFRLIEEYRRENEISMWRARHQMGRFDCALLISERGEDGLRRVQTEFEMLGRVFHPNVCRVFEAGSIDERRHYIARAWNDGRSLAGLIRDNGGIDGDLLKKIAKQTVSALQYLHSVGITHRNIKPASLIINQENVVLIDLGMTDPDDTRSGSIAFRDPRVVEGGWNEEADLYSLALTLLCAVNGAIMPPLVTSENWDEFVSESLGRLPIELRDGTKSALDLFPSGLPTDYLEFFGLGDEEQLLTAFPEEFRVQWEISKGYMEFLVVDMLNDARTRSRKQWVLGALRSRHIAGNRTNYGSMNSTVSRLLSAGIAEKYGKKVRLTSGFLQAWKSESK